MQDQALGSVFAELADFVLFQGWEGDAGGFGIEDPFKVGAGEAVHVGEDCVELGLEVVAAMLIPREWVALVAEFFGEAAHFFGGVSQLKHFGKYQLYPRSSTCTHFKVCLRRQDRKLLDIEETHMYTTD